MFIKPTGMVFFVLDVIKTFAYINSFQMLRTQTMIVEAMIGWLKGIMIDVNILKELAPSM
jgi:hypothetical protein